MSAYEMCRRFVNDMEKTFENWIPRKRFTMFEVKDHEKKMKNNGLGLTKKIEAGNVYIPSGQK